MNRSAAIAVLALCGLALYGVLRLTFPAEAAHSWSVEWPLAVVLVAGGGLLVVDLLVKLLRGEFGSDLLAGLSIVTSLWLDEYVAGAVVVLMLSGGETLESFAVRRASSALEALAKRLPATAHRKINGHFEDVALSDVAVGDRLVVLPHESCPVDGVVVEGHGSMDEAYLTGEPYRVAKAPGATVLSGAVNGEAALTIEAVRPAQDSRYAKIMQVMRDSEQRRPRMRRIADQLGAVYTPLAVALGLAAWWASGEPLRFLAVLVVATPCPLLIAIPVAVIGAVSLAARRGIIIRDPAVLEKLSTCRVAIFDKTGTLTYGRPDVTEILTAPGVDGRALLSEVASIERYSKHPLASAVLARAETERLVVPEAAEVHEPPGQGLSGIVGGRRIAVLSRKQILRAHPEIEPQLPPIVPGMECVVLRDDRYAATLRFRDLPRSESRGFISHLQPKHQLERVLLVSGDRAVEVNHLAELVGIREVFASQSPEQKLELVRRETARAPTVFIGDGINDAPALTAATVGIGVGGSNDVTSEAAGAVVLESSMEKVDELLHIAARFRRVALQSAVGGMLLSAAGMIVAAFGLLPPVSGALLQEAIDVIALLNALRAARMPQARAKADFPIQDSTVLPRPDPKDPAP
jgi:heavy metal translocating P-type ATPase